MGTKPLLTLKRKAPDKPHELPTPQDVPMAMPTVLALYKRHLREFYPYLFPAVGEVPLLAIGIHRQLLAARPEGVPYRTVRNALHFWVSEGRYRAALAKGGPRLNLDGTPQTAAEALRLLKGIEGM